MDDHYVRMAERVAALEKQAEHADARDAATATTMADIRTQLSALNAKITRWEGKFGGVIFVVSCIWVFLTGAPKAILAWLQTSGGPK